MYLHPVCNVSYLFWIIHIQMFIISKYLFQIRPIKKIVLLCYDFCKDVPMSLMLNKLNFPTHLCAAASTIFRRQVAETQLNSYW